MGYKKKNSKKFLIIKNPQDNWGLFFCSRYIYIIMNLQEQISRIRQIIETVNSENTFNFTTDGGETHQYQVESVTDSTKSIPLDKTNPRGEKKTFNTKIIKLKWLNPPSNLLNAEGLTVVKICGDDNIKPPRGYRQSPKEFINYVNGLC